MMQWQFAKFEICNLVFLHGHFLCMSILTWKPITNLNVALISYIPHKIGAFDYMSPKTLLLDKYQRKCVISSLSSWNLVNSCTATPAQIPKCLKIWQQQTTKDSFRSKKRWFTPVSFNKYIFCERGTLMRGEVPNTMNTVSAAAFHDKITVWMHQWTLFIRSEIELCKPLVISTQPFKWTNYSQMNMEFCS